MNFIHLIPVEHERATCGHNGARIDQSDCNKFLSYGPPMPSPDFCCNSKTLRKPDRRTMESSARDRNEKKLPMREVPACTAQRKPQWYPGAMHILGPILLLLAFAGCASQTGADRSQSHSAGAKKSMSRYERQQAYDATRRVRTLQMLSSGRIGCTPPTIVIENHQEWDGKETWAAVYDSQKFFCSKQRDYHSGGLSVSIACTPARR